MVPGVSAAARELHGRKTSLALAYGIGASPGFFLWTLLPLLSSAVLPPEGAPGVTPFVSVLLTAVPMGLVAGGTTDLSGLRPLGSVPPRASRTTTRAPDVRTNAARLTSSVRPPSWGSVVVNPGRVDSITDLAYGILIATAIVLIVVVGETVGIAFAFGVLVSYVIHVAWKMARYDPDWMTREVSETVEETISQEVEEVKDEIQDVNERVDRRPRIDELEDEVVAADASRTDGDR